MGSEMVEKRPPNTRSKKNMEPNKLLETSMVSKERQRQKGTNIELHGSLII